MSKPSSKEQVFLNEIRNEFTKAGCDETEIWCSPEERAIADSLVSKGLLEITEESKSGEFAVMLHGAFNCIKLRHLEKNL